MQDSLWVQIIRTYKRISRIPRICYVNSYVKSKAAVEASIAACFGEKEFTGKNPVKLN